MTDKPAVLYVEDDLSSRQVMQILLGGRMALPHVTMFEDSENFVARVQALDPKPDVIFLDIHVEPYSGFEMLAMLRELEDFRQTPVVALTASVMNEEVEQLKMAGFHSCLAKPIDLTTFPIALQDILNGNPVWVIIG